MAIRAGRGGGSGWRIALGFAPALWRPCPPVLPLSALAPSTFAPPSGSGSGGKHVGTQLDQREIPAPGRLVLPTTFPGAMALQ